MVQLRLILNYIWYKEFESGPSKIFLRLSSTNFTTAQKMKFSIKDFLNKCDQIRSFLRIRSHLLKKSVMENFIFVQCTWSTLEYFVPFIRYIIFPVFRVPLSIYSHRPCKLLKVFETAMLAANLIRYFT